MYQPDKFADLLPSKPSSFPEPDRASRIILDAAHLIRTHGLAKDVREDATGFCLHGALAKAEFGVSKNERWCPELDGDSYKRVFYFMVSFGEVTPDAWHLAGWNNAPERTAAEVISALEAAAFYSEPVSA